MKKNFAKKVSISVMSAAMAATMMPAAAFAATGTSAADAKTPAPIVKTDASSQAQNAQKTSQDAQKTQKTDASKTAKDSKTTKKDSKTTKTSKVSKKAVKKAKKTTKKTKKNVKKAKVQAPVNFKAEKIGTDTAKLSWDAVKGADSYTVYIMERGFHFRKIAQVKDTSYTVKIPENHENSYIVKAVKGNKESGRSCITTVYMQGNLTPVTAKSLLVKKSGKATLTWDKVKGATVYYVYAKDADGVSNFKGIAYGKKTSLTMRNVKEGKSYNINIVAYGKFGRTPDNFVKVMARKAASKDSSTNSTKVSKTTKTKKDAKGSKKAKTKADSSKAAQTTPASATK